MSGSQFSDPSCNTNPVLGLGSAINQMGQQAGEARQFSGPGKQQGMGPGPQYRDQLQRGPRDRQGDAFSKAFEQGPMVHGPGPIHHFGMTGPQGPIDDMHQSFESMRLMEQIYRDSQQPFVPPPQFAQNLQSQHKEMHDFYNQSQQGPQWQPNLPQLAQMPVRPVPSQYSMPPQYGGMGMGMGMGMGPMMGMGMGPMSHHMYNPQLHMPMQQQPQTRQPVKIEEVKEAQPAPQMGGGGVGMSQEMVQQLLQSDDPKWRNSKFLKFIDKVSRGEIEFRDNQAVETKPVETKVDDEQALRDALAADDWGNYDEGSFPELQAALERARMQSPVHRDPEYTFKEGNPFTHKENPFQEGLKLFQQGKLKQAIMAFEAAVQADAQHADAWRYLGQAQAENEEEKLAIAALLKCISLDPYHLPALMMLGVSYTNDLEEVRALNYLKTWMLNNPDYAGQIKSQQDLAEYEELYGGSGHTLDSNLHNQVTKMFLEATQINPKDADLHTVLGVLYHISNDFDKAVEAFRTACTLRPEDPQLWNKLGATLANSSRSPEALNAYKRALSLRPTYVRALSNLAISFANQGLHGDAVRTYLAALKQNPNADHVWSYLRISLSHMGREDLIELTMKKNVELFRPHFQF